MEWFHQVTSPLKRDTRFRLIWEDLVSIPAPMVSNHPHSHFHIEAAKDLEMGNQTSKQHSELKNLRKSDYKQSLSDRIKEGLEVKTFQNQKRIDFGRMDSNERNYRQRSK